MTDTASELMEHSNYLCSIIKEVLPSEAREARFQYFSSLLLDKVQVYVKHEIKDNCTDGKTFWWSLTISQLLRLSDLKSR